MRRAQRRAVHALYNLPAGDNDRRLPVRRVYSCVAMIVVASLIWKVLNGNGMQLLMPPCGADACAVPHMRVKRGWGSLQYPTRVEEWAMPTTSTTALVKHALLIQSDDSRDALPAGSPAGYAWLAVATAFAFRRIDGAFTAYKEHRSSMHT